MTQTTDWVNCPICGEPDMRFEPEKGEDGRGYIRCTNLACASNGGTNSDALDARKKQAVVDLSQFSLGVEWRIVEIVPNHFHVERRYWKEPGFFARAFFAMFVGGKPSAHWTDWEPLSGTFSDYDSPKPIVFIGREAAERRAQDERTSYAISRYSTGGPPLPGYPQVRKVYS